MSSFVRSNLHNLVSDAAPDRIRAFVNNNDAILRFLLHQYVNSLTYQYIEDPFQILDEWHCQLTASNEPSMITHRSSPRYTTATTDILTSTNVSEVDDTHMNDVLLSRQQSRRTVLSKSRQSQLSGISPSPMARRRRRHNTHTTTLLPFNTLKKRKSKCKSNRRGRSVRSSSYSGPLNLSFFAQHSVNHPSRYHPIDVDIEEETEHPPLPPVPAISIDGDDELDIAEEEAVEEEEEEEEEEEVGSTTSSDVAAATAIRINRNIHSYIPSLGEPVPLQHQSATECLNQNLENNLLSDSMILNHNFMDTPPPPPLSLGSVSSTHKQHKSMPTGIGLHLSKPSNSRHSVPTSPNDVTLIKSVSDLTGHTAAPLISSAPSTTIATAVIAAAATAPPTRISIVENSGTATATTSEKNSNHSSAHGSESGSSPGHRRGQTTPKLQQSVTDKAYGYVSDEDSKDFATGVDLSEDDEKESSASVPPKVIGIGIGGGVPPHRMGVFRMNSGRSRTSSKSVTPTPQMGSHVTTVSVVPSWSLMKSLPMSVEDDDDEKSTCTSEDHLSASGIARLIPHRQPPLPSMMSSLPMSKTTVAAAVMSHRSAVANPMNSSSALMNHRSANGVNSSRRLSMLTTYDPFPFTSALSRNIENSTFGSIPHDLWLRIFTYIESKKQITQLGRVCREFHLIAIRTFSSAPQNRSAVVKTSRMGEFPPVICFQYWHHLNGIIISGSITDTPLRKLEFKAFLKVIVRACPNLRHFQMRRAKDSSSDDPKIRMQFLHYLHEFEHLETVYIEHHVKMRDCRTFLFHNKARLKKFAIASHWEKYTLPPHILPSSLEELHIPYLAGNEWILEQTLPNLRVLVFYMTTKSKQRPLSILDYLVKNCGRLQRLVIKLVTEDCEQLCEYLQRLFDNCKELSHIRIGMDVRTPAEANDIYQQLRNDPYLRSIVDMSYNNNFHNSCALFRFDKKSADKDSAHIKDKSSVNNPIIDFLEPLDPDH